MSEKNVEIIRTSFDALNRTLADGGNDFYEFLHPEIEWVPITALFEGGSYRGIDAVRGFMDDLRRDWETYEVTCEDVRDLGDDRVLALGTYHARGRRSGVELDLQQAAWLYRLRDGKMVRMQTFTARSQALEAIGLSE